MFIGLTQNSSRLFSCIRPSISYFFLIFVGPQLFLIFVSLSTPHLFIIVLPSNNPFPHCHPPPLLMVLEKGSHTFGSRFYSAREFYSYFCQAVHGILYVVLKYCSHRLIRLGQQHPPSPSSSISSFEDYPVVASLAEPLWLSFHLSYCLTGLFGKRAEFPADSDQTSRAPCKEVIPIRCQFL